MTAFATPEDIANRTAAAKQAAVAAGRDLGLEITEGKVLYMAVPRLRSEKCFVEIDPQRLGKKAVLAASIAGACKYGRAVSPREMRPVDLVVCGSVAVGRDGARLGKGGGYCDLEYGLLREEGKVRESTPILTTVHALQVAADRIAMLPHDLPVDFYVTPQEVVAENLLLLQVDFLKRSLGG